MDQSIKPVTSVTMTWVIVEPNELRSYGGEQDWQIQKLLKIQNLAIFSWTFLSNNSPRKKKLTEAMTYYTTLVRF